MELLQSCVFVYLYIIGIQTVASASLLDNATTIPTRSSEATTAVSEPADYSTIESTPSAESVSTTELSDLDITTTDQLSLTAPSTHPATVPTTDLITVESAHSTTTALRSPLVLAVSSTAIPTTTDQTSTACATEFLPLVPIPSLPLPPPNFANTTLAATASPSPSTPTFCTTDTACGILIPLPSLSLPPPSFETPAVPAPTTCTTKIACGMFLHLPSLSLPPPSFEISPVTEPNCTASACRWFLPLPTLSLPPPSIITTPMTTNPPTPVHFTASSVMLPLPPLSLPPTANPVEIPVRKATGILLPLPPLPLPPHFRQTTVSTQIPPVGKPPIFPLPPLSLPPTKNPTVTASHHTATLRFLPLPPLTVPPPSKPNISSNEAVTTRPFLSLPTLTLPPTNKPLSVTTIPLLPLPLLTVPPPFKSNASVATIIVTSAPFLTLPPLTLSPTMITDVTPTTTSPITEDSTLVPTTKPPFLLLPHLTLPPTKPLVHSTTPDPTTTFTATSDPVTTLITTLKAITTDISTARISTTKPLSGIAILLPLPPLTLPPTKPLVHSTTPDPTTTFTTTSDPVTTLITTTDPITTDISTAQISTTKPLSGIAILLPLPPLSLPHTKPSIDSSTEYSTTSLVATPGPSTTTTTTSTTTTSTTTTTTTTSSTTQPSVDTTPTRPTQMSFKMTLDAENCTDQIEDVYSLEYNETLAIFELIIFSVSEFIDIRIIKVSGLTFSCGSIIGEGFMELLSTTTSNAAQISTEFNEVIQSRPPGLQAIQIYEVTKMDVLDVDECRTGQHNCHWLYGHCTNEDPGFSCSCRSGYVELNPENPGRSCKALCLVNGFPYCLNGGSCTNGTGAADPTCNCTSGFSGRRCQIDDTLREEETTTYESATNATLNTTITYNATTPYSTTPNSTNGTMSTVMTSTVPTSTKVNTTFVTEAMNTTNATLNTTSGYISFSCNEILIIGDNFTFSPTKPGSSSYSEELCANNEGSKASIFCSNANVYDLTSIVESSCKSLPSILDEPYTEQTMKNLEFATADISTLTTKKVVDISHYLFDIANRITRFSASEVEDAAEIFNHLTQHYLNETVSEVDFVKERQELVISLTKISRKLNADSARFTVITQDINIEVYDATSVSAYQFGTNFTKKGNSSWFVPVYLQLPSAALEAAKSMVSPLRIVALGFRSSVLFPSKKKTDWVISASLGDSTDSIEGISLAEPIVIRSNDVELPAQNQINQFKKIVTTLDCVFWDFEFGDWSENGCFMQPGIPATCTCNHLTNFAILVSRTELPADVALGVLTYIGCALSIAGLVVTFLVICSSRVMRRKYQMRILGNICLCLTVALSLFVFGVDSQIDTVNCSILAAFMQYFYLTTWFWTAVYSLTIYRDIVQVMRSYQHSFKLHLASLFAYGVPLVIVLLNAGITLGHIDTMDAGDEFAESSYRARNFCWLRHFSLYFGFLVPVAILLLLNIAIFCVVIPKVTCRQAQIQSSKAKRRTSQNIAVCFSLATTMGFSWIFGYLMLISDEAVFLVTMSWLFTIVNSFQGVIIFYFTVIRTGEIRRLYAPVSQLFSSAPVLSTSLSTRNQGSHSQSNVSSIA